MAILLKRTVLVAASALLIAAGHAAADERLPDGDIARAACCGAVAAWYGRPTDRYGHGVLGDSIEGGSLVVLDDLGVQHETVLPEHHVFEDLTPRIVDLDRDGRNEVVTIRTDVGKGAAVAIYGLRNGKLAELASSSPIGISNRWLSIAAIGDFLGDGRDTIAVVKMPHLGGILELHRFGSDGLAVVRGPAPGYSTHRIGSRELTLALAADMDGDGRPELILPDRSLRKIFALDLSTDLTVRSEWSLPERISGRVVRDSSGALRITLESGRAIVLKMDNHSR